MGKITARIFGLFWIFSISFFIIIILAQMQISPQIQLIVDILIIIAAVYLAWKMHTRMVEVDKARQEAKKIQIDRESQKIPERKVETPSVTQSVKPVQKIPGTAPELPYARQAGSGACDLCGHRLPENNWYRIPCREFRESVKNGFNPIINPEIDWSMHRQFKQLTGDTYSDSLYFSYWKNQVMNIDSSDWGLCPKCAAAVFTYIRSPLESTQRGGGTYTHYSPATKISIPPKMNYSEINYSDVDPEVLEQNKRNWEREEKSRLDAEIRKKEEKQKEKAESGVYTRQNDIKIGNNEERVSISFTDKDNLGTRQDNIHQANAYWLARNISQKFTPFILYTFEKESDARDALLELDCIHVAKDTGSLICTEPLYFGYYRRDDGKYSAVVIGESLTHELWVAAKDGFAKHRGQRKNDQEPETRESHNPETKMVKPDQVTFVQEKRQQGQMGETLIYRIYKAPDAVSAKAFLQQNPVNEKLTYIVVETPDGNYGRDIEGMYKE